MVNRVSIKARIESLLGQYDRRFLPTDPVFHVHRFQDPRDQEMVGFLVALLSFGNAKAIQGSVAKLLARIGPRPVRFLAGFDPGRDAEAFEGLGHRWVRDRDITRLFALLQRILDRHSSLKPFFLEGFREGDADAGPMLDRFSERVKGMEDGRPMSRGYRYFFPAPRDGSSCKRLNMFLRWMVRPADGVDLGLWPEIPASKLIIPLDVHVYRFGRKFRLSRYKTPHWRFAREVTDFLKSLDPQDPVKYDFAICHYGMETGW